MGFTAGVFTLIIIAGGMAAVSLAMPNEAMGFSRKGVWTHTPVPAHMCIVLPSGAFESQLGGTFMLHIAYIYIYTEVYIYIHT